jgi:hypothetical protein
MVFLKDFKVINWFNKISSFFSCFWVKNGFFSYKTSILFFSYRSDR